MMMPMDADVACFFAKDSVPPFQILVNGDNLVLSRLAAAAADKPGKSHSPIRVEHSKKPTIKRTIQNFTIKPVLPIRLDYTIPMGDIYPLSLDFQDGVVMDMRADRFFKEIPKCEVMVAAEQMDRHTRLNKVCQRPD